jgi:His-Xaa-Ser system radical SAM maturase HxsC
MYLHSVGKARNAEQSFVGRLTASPIDQRFRRRDYIVDARSLEADAFWVDSEGYAGVVSPTVTAREGQWSLPELYGFKNLEYLGEGDVVACYPDGSISVLFRKSSPHNTLLATERCNSLCLMCSQPPRLADDSYRVVEILRAIELMDPACTELGISGGEPTLLGEDFLRIVMKAKEYLPGTALHILSNGRLFADRSFAEALGSIEHPDLMLGIPLYSDIDQQHDYVVQAKGAYDETIRAFYHLAAANVPIELRVVVHAATCDRLPQLAEFVYRNLPFVSHVALMGLEMYGYVHLNMDKLWIDPFDYQDRLAAAVHMLAERGMTVSVYNHQLCTIPRSIWPFARKSISDWKNVYLAECESCGVRESCGGFFQSATKKHSRHIRPLSFRDPIAQRPAPRVCNSSDVA